MRHRNLLGVLGFWGFGEIAGWSLRHYQISPFKEVQLSKSNEQASTEPTGELTLRTDEESR